MRVPMICFVLLVFAFLTSAGGCGSSQSSDSSEPSAEPAPEPFALSSPAFEAGGGIPVRYTCDGKSLSPPLRWSHAPEGTRSFALICDDPDAVKVVGYTFIHWVIFNVPASADSLGEGVPPKPGLADGSRQGKNSTSRIGYIGPCPPQGDHRYFFRLYALDAVLDLEPGVSAEQLRKAMEGHVLARAELMVVYRRQ